MSKSYKRACFFPLQAKKFWRSGVRSPCFRLQGSYRKLSGRDSEPISSIIATVSPLSGLQVSWEKNVASRG